VTGPLLGLLLLALLSASGLLVATALRIRRPAELIVAVYIVASAEIVGLSLLLSPFDAFTRGALLAGLVALCAAAFAVWVLVGAHRPPSLPRLPRTIAHRDGPLLVLAIGVVLGLAYVVALIVGTPPNGWDPLNYHLARAAFWVQSDGVGYISDAYDQRLNFNPPNGEIGFAFVLALTRDENLVGFVQFFAALAAATGVFAIARRIGLRRREACFGALAFLSLPLVALQASGAKNDLIVGAYLVAAALFLLSDSPLEISLGCIATALAAGTKFTAAYGLVILLALVLLAPHRARRRLGVAALVFGALVGSYWYVVNAHETGRLLGDQSNVPGLTAPLHPPENVLTAFGALVDTLDLSGARGADIAFYAIAALALALILTSWRQRGIGALAVGAAPLLFLLVSEHLGRPALLHLDNALGHPKGYVGTGNPAASPTIASDTASCYGPAGLILAIGALLAAVRLARRRLLPPTAVVVALAPVAAYVLVSLTLTYNPWLGRFLVFPIALSATLWGLALRSSTAGWAAAALATVTLSLSLVHYAEKPSGLRLLDRGAGRASVWTMARWQVQSQHDPAIGPVFEFLDKDVPRSTTIALALSANDFGYPAFGPNLDRRVELVPFGSDARAVETDWLVASRERVTEIDASCWRDAFRSDEGSVFRRSAGCRG
jgi:hypothetical protein